MRTDELIDAVTAYMARSADNRLKPEYGPDRDLEGAPLFDAPLFGFGDASDPLFEELCAPGVVGPHYLPPRRWLPEARTVISFFCPFSEQVRWSNRADDGQPSAAWRIGRIEGQDFIASLQRFIASLLDDAGHTSCIPIQDPRFAVVKPAGSNPLFDPDEAFTSTWSERHVAHVCGLGTFGLSAGLITERGVAGRLGSLVTDAVFPVTSRPYTHHDEYCIRCGACIRRCPVGAISFERGKEHPPCSAFLDEMKNRFAPRFGCGKCQVGVPCESGIPSPARDL